MSGARHEWWLDLVRQSSLKYRFKGPLRPLGLGVSRTPTAELRVRLLPLLSRSKRYGKQDTSTDPCGGPGGCCSRAWPRAREVCCVCVSVGVTVCRPGHIYEGREPYIYSGQVWFCCIVPLLRSKRYSTENKTLLRTLLRALAARASTGGLGRSVESRSRRRGDIELLPRKPAACGYSAP